MSSKKATKEPDLADLIVLVRCGDEIAKSELKRQIYPAIRLLISRRLGKESVEIETVGTFDGIVNDIQTGSIRTVRTLATIVISSCDDGRYIRPLPRRDHSNRFVSSLRAKKPEFCKRELGPLLGASGGTASARPGGLRLGSDFQEALGALAPRKKSPGHLNWPSQRTSIIGGFTPKDGH